MRFQISGGSAEDGPDGYEPASTLAASLKPLLRLRRYDEARTNHLRGYRLLQGHVELRTAFGSHIEFCVLSGNRERALEILAENRRVFDPPYEPSDYLEFLSCVALLLRGCVDAGSTATVAGPEGRDWPAAKDADSMHVSTSFTLTGVVPIDGLPDTIWMTSFTDTTTKRLDGAELFFERSSKPY